MNRQLRIGSYFSIETDLAAEMKDWPEFVSGDGYSVDLKSQDTGEEVSVRYAEYGEECFVVVRSSGDGLLFDRVVGRSIYAMSHHSDNLWVDTHV